MDYNQIYQKVDTEFNSLLEKATIPQPSNKLSPIMHFKIE